MKFSHYNLGYARAHENGVTVRGLVDGSLDCSVARESAALCCCVCGARNNRCSQRGPRCSNKQSHERERDFHS